MTRPPEQLAGRGPRRAAQVPAPVTAWREALATDRAALRARYERDRSAHALVRRHAALVDRHLRAAWTDAGLPQSAALLAAGGYGRRELYPCSDIDLLVLLPAAPDAGLERRLESFIGRLWDIGLEVAHSVRTVEQCAELARGDVTVQTTQLEARFLIGSRRLATRFTRAMDQLLDPAAFLQAKQLEQQQRHTRFLDSANNLEPNLKDSPGGLRDLHTILWVARAARSGASWRELQASGLITAEEAARLRRDHALLRDLRVRLHYLAGRREDRLLFDLQTRLAASLGLRDGGPRRASELLMQRYYRTARSVGLLNALLLQILHDRLVGRGDSPVEPIDEHFQRRGQLLEIRDPGLFERHPETILGIFHALQRRQALTGMTVSTMRALWPARRRVDAAFRRDPGNRARFLAILREPVGVVRTLRRMHQVGVLGRYLPVFGRIVGQMQHDLFHVYTVDEHILRVVRNVRRFTVPQFAHEYPLCSRLISDFERPELLYIAALFHDIAKGRGGDHSLLGGAEAARFCRIHGIGGEDAALVRWLVEQHLALSTTAQKQDIGDPAVVAAFAQRVATERRLIALYLLTVADIRGTSPKVWNGWKAKLLEDLFRATRRYLAGGAIDADSNLQARQREALQKLALYALLPEQVRPLWEQFEAAYFIRLDAQEIAWHARHLWNRVDSAEPVIRGRPSPSGDGLQVMVYVREQPELFARICGFFERIGFSIVEARITTTRHEYALDTFTVLDPSAGNHPYRDLIGYIEHELKVRLLQRAPLAPPAGGRISRQLRSFPIAPAVDIRMDERGAYRILSIVAGDRPGLLSTVARTLVDYRVSVHAALINTLGERVEDTFLVSGPSLDDERTVLRLESDLLAALAS
jgi:[protein-PII] uridylyltransferase